MRMSKNKLRHSPAKEGIAGEPNKLRHSLARGGIAGEPNKLRHSLARGGVAKLRRGVENDTIPTRGE